eukprot:TRINITY_DN19928_c0_g1_i2.p1 TRINITY_DN19928_c0_g1~~TRINITY_DN19928_c0_g1_i2.p1  ORF type:complete len:236 (+),score=56.84 TRINITY_DN19928_c0_g1_i2:43-708(+)
MARRLASYVLNLRLTLFLVFADVIFTACNITVHHQEKSVEDLINIGLLSIHGTLFFCHLGLIWLSVSPTVKYKAGLIGELTKIAVMPTTLVICRMLVMAVPWVYRRWILKGTTDDNLPRGSLYWDDWVYRIAMGVNMCLMFGFVHSIAKMHYQLTKTTNYAEHSEKYDEMRLLQAPAFFVEPRRWPEFDGPTSEPAAQRPRGSVGTAGQPAWGRMSVASQE